MLTLHHSLWRRANTRKDSFETLNGGQFTSSTQLIKPNYLELSHWSSTTVSVETYPLHLFLIKSIRKKRGMMSSNSEQVTALLNLFSIYFSRRWFHFRGRKTVYRIQWWTWFFKDGFSLGECFELSILPVEIYRCWLWIYAPLDRRWGTNACY